MNITSLRHQLANIKQEQVLRFFDQLDRDGKEKLAGQILALDLPAIGELIQTQVKAKGAIPLPTDIRPVDAFPHTPDAKRRTLYAEAEARARVLLKEGKVGAFLVAGGQGTRLGYNGPKGEYFVTPVRNKPLFQVFAEQLRAHSRDSGRTIPWYIMTSDVNDAPTRAFFHQHHYFGYAESDVFFFQQGMMPAFSMDGEMLLGSEDSLALSPDGHGGSLRALHKSGALADMKTRGVEHLSYFQVDNPLVHCIDPLFIGLHDLTGSEMSSKTIPKANAMEKVGNFVIGDGKLQVIEYSDLPEKLALQTNPDGSPRFNAGSIAIHALRVSFIERLNSGGRLELPWHCAEKKVPYVDAAGQTIKPERPNAVKLEQFVFDAIPLAKNAIVYTTDRAEEFSPVKNAEGVDSPDSCRRDQVRRAARWLMAAGVQVPMRAGEPDVLIEISPLLATSAAQLSKRKVRIAEIAGGEPIYLDEPSDRAEA
jgi:UDP-N-acetylglucosamine/UDP-N-acetylgalactosamine diphosphorylase